MSVESVDAAVLPMDIDIDAVRPSAFTSSQESGVCGPGDSGGDVADGRVGLWVPCKANSSFKSRTVIGPCRLDDADDKSNGCQHG